MNSSHQNTAAPTGGEGVASTFLRRGVGATQEPISEFGLKVKMELVRRPFVAGADFRGGRRVPKNRVGGEG